MICRELERHSANGLMRILHSARKMINTKHQLCVDMMQESPIRTIIIPGGADQITQIILHKTRLIGSQSWYLFAQQKYRAMVLLLRWHSSVQLLQFENELCTLELVSDKIFCEISNRRPIKATCYDLELGAGKEKKICENIC